MNPTVTTEELLALAKSADLLRQTAEKAMRCDDLARELNRVKIDRDAWESAAQGHYENERVWRERYDAEVARNGDLLRENETLARNMPPEPPADFAAAASEASKLELARNALEVLSKLGNGDRVGNSVGNVIAARALEAISRNVPPEPPADASSREEPTIKVTKVLGQQWCKTDRATTDLVNFAFKFGMQTHYLVLCNVHKDVQTGALTYHPVRVKDLPFVQ